ncbi:hypothetical protein K439DRAFT_1664603 [Ramaria rubella]|nr:hypothetical protein K439DRAFT_1664603 [Ramaria rubella]
MQSYDIKPVETALPQESGMAWQPLTPHLEGSPPGMSKLTYNGSRLRRHRESISSSSGSSVWEPVSPIGRRLSASQHDAVVQPDIDAEDAPWNLIAYHVPWGPCYEGYEAGTLPGPNGTCLFLRSPTPLKRQRTSQACDKCRERKAKCSGTRPSCNRCASRGLACVYGTSTSTSIPSDPSPRRSARANQEQHNLPTSIPCSKRPKPDANARQSRKSSLADSEASTASGSLPEWSPELIDGMRIPVTPVESSKDWNNEALHTYPRPSESLQEINTLTGMPCSSYTQLSTPERLSHGFSAFPRDYDLAISRDIPMYATTSPGLNEYRFPPLENVKDIALQPSRHETHGLSSMYSIAACNTSHFDHSLLASRRLGLMWQESGLGEDPQSRSDMTFSDGSLPSSSGDTTFFDPRYNAESTPNGNPQDYPPSQQYDPTLAVPFS